MGRSGRFVVTFALLIGAGATILGQLPIPVQGQRGGPNQQATKGQRGQRGGTPEAPAPTPVCAPISTVSSYNTWPGKFYETLMEFKPTDDLAHFNYVTKEYFVSGTANGQPYKTRIVIRKPADNSTFSGLVLAESMHPS